MIDTTIKYEQIAPAFARGVQEFHQSLSRDEQELLELVFALAEKAASGDDLAGYADLGRFFAQHARPFVAAVAVAGILGLVGATAVPSAHADGLTVGVVQTAASLTANPNPIVLTAGQTTGSTVVTWDAKSRVAPTFVLSVDGGPDQPVDVLTRRGNTSASVTVNGFEAGRSYRLRMLSGNGGQVIGETTITAGLPKTAQAAATNPTTTTTTNPATTTTTTNNQGAATAAAPKPAPRVVAKLTPHGTFADFSASSDVPARMDLRVSTSAPEANYRLDPVIASTDSAGLVNTFDPTVEGLFPGSTYFWVLRATGADGQTTFREGSFRTLERFVTVTIDSITIDRDGNLLIPSYVAFDFSMLEASATTPDDYVTDGDVVRPKVSLTTPTHGAPLVPLTIIGRGNLQRSSLEQVNAVSIAFLNVSRPGTGEAFVDSFTAVGDDGLLFKYTVTGQYQVSYR